MIRLWNTIKLWISPPQRFMHYPNDCAIRMHGYPNECSDYRKAFPEHFDKAGNYNLAPRGYMWRNINGVRTLVCDTCGGNCGQCGETDRLGNIPIDFDYMIKENKWNEPPAGFHQR